MTPTTRQCVILGLISWACAWFYSNTYVYPVEQTLWLCRLTGYITLGFLFGSLSISPVRRLVRSPKLPPYRRALGITAFGSGLAHAILSSIQYFGDAPWFMPLLEPFLRMGVLTLGILAVLWVTSFPRWVKAMKLRTWRELHWLAYAAGLTALLHVVLSPFAPVREVLLTMAVWLVFGMLRLIPRRP